MCAAEEQAIQRGRRLLLKHFGRGVYIMTDNNGKWHAYLSLHCKGKLHYIIGLDDNLTIVVEHVL